MDGYGNISMLHIREDRDTQSSVEGGLLLAPRTASVRACHVVHHNVTKETWAYVS